MKTEIAKTITLSESEIQTAIINYIEKEKQIRHGQNSIKASLTLKTIE